MRYKEMLNWIVYKKGYSVNEEEQDRLCIDFVHSLGKKCDSVGWSELDLDEPNADDVLNKIQAFCKKNRWGLRCWYERTYVDADSDWYELKTEYFKGATVSDFVPVPAENGKTVTLESIRAYRELTCSPKANAESCVADRFREACIKYDITDVDFCWVQDVGKYEAEQYFYIYPHIGIPRVFCDRKLKKRNIKALGGYLPKIASMADDFIRIGLQDCYLKKDMPTGGIAYVYCPTTNNFCGRSTILIHKDIATQLISEKVLSAAYLTPACVVETAPKGYTCEKTKRLIKPSKEYIQSAFERYEQLKAKGRPPYIVSETEALKILRAEKRKRISDFNKKIATQLIEEIKSSLHRHVLPYYQVSNGGILSDEYQFLSYAESLKATAELYAEWEREELLETKPNGIVIATCANGDCVLLTSDENVAQFSHEASELQCGWPTLAMFFVETIDME